MKIVILDCSYIAHRAKFAMRNLSYKEKQTGIIYALLSKTLEMCEKFDTNRVWFAWDSQLSLRKQIYPDYKLRDKTDITSEDLMLDQMVHEQLPLTRLEILPRIGFRNSFLARGYEADDVIASLAIKYGNDIVVVSRDKDLYQLLDFCDMYNPESKTLYTKESLMKEYGCTPNEWIRVKAIAGCASDNVQGVDGVAEKTAVKYIQGNLKPTYTACKNIKYSKRLIDFNWQLVCLPFKDCPSFVIQDEVFYIEDFLDVCQEYGFNSFVDKKLNKWRDRFQMKRKQ